MFSAIVKWVKTRIENLKMVVSEIKGGHKTVPAAILALLGSKTVRYALLVLFIFLAVLAYRWHVYDKGFVAGRDAALSKVIAQNQKAENLAEKTRQEMAECSKKGFAWNVSTGKCQE